MSDLPPAVRPGSWLWLAAALLAAALAPAGCDPPPTAIPPGPAPVIAPPVRQRPIPQAPVAVPEDGADAGAEATAPAAPGTPGGTAPAGGEGAGLVRDGGPCERAIECASGICEGLGCSADRRGVCMSRNRSCTRDLRQYCGCDGKTFQSSGSCPGRRFSARGPCR